MPAKLHEHHQSHFKSIVSRRNNHNRGMPKGKVQSAIIRLNHLVIIHLITLHPSFISFRFRSVPFSTHKFKMIARAHQPHKYTITICIAITWPRAFYILNIAYYNKFAGAWHGIRRAVFSLLF